jgi:MFS family permease
MTFLTARPQATGNAALVLLTMSPGVLIAQIDTSVVNLAVKRIGAEFDAGVNTLQWVVDAYNLVYASLLLTAGTLADLYGRRKLFAFGMALYRRFAHLRARAKRRRSDHWSRHRPARRRARSADVACDPRHGLSGHKKRTHALGLWASCNGLAFTIGPTIGGLLVDAVGWRSIFLLIVPLCALALLLTTTSVPESKDPKGRRLDVPGQRWRLPPSAHFRSRRLKDRAGLEQGTGGPFDRDRHD